MKIVAGNVDATTTSINIIAIFLSPPQSAHVLKHNAAGEQQVRDTSDNKVLFGDTFCYDHTSRDEPYRHHQTEKNQIRGLDEQQKAKSSCLQVPGDREADETANTFSQGM